MNILPKKRWHVRTKDNIARVRRDEAEARESERIREEKLKFAESEARINILRKQSGLAEISREYQQHKQSEQSVDQKHIDLFSDYKSHVKTTNKELEKEKKDEKEKYEKQIGYLTYLGQDTNEALKLKSWYEVAPKNRNCPIDSKKSEKDLKKKFDEDPLTIMKALLPKKEATKGNDHIKTISNCQPIIGDFNGNEMKSSSTSSLLNELTSASKLHSNDGEPQPKKAKLKSCKSSRKPKKEKKLQSKKHKKHNKSKDPRDKNRYSDELPKNVQLASLRNERLKREAEERQRAEALLSSLNPSKKPETKSTVPVQRIVQRYNSQFNPDIAKQNML